MSKFYRFRRQEGIVIKVLHNNGNQEDGDDTGTSNREVTVIDICNGTRVKSLLSKDAIEISFCAMSEEEKEIIKKIEVSITVEASELIKGVYPIYSGVSAFANQL